MKIQPINHTTFESKINYNKTIKAGFELAEKNTNSPRKKDLDFAKNFTDNIRTILEDKSQDTIIIDGEKRNLNEYISNEGYKCTVELNKIASNNDKKATNKYIDSLKSQLEGTMALVEELKEKYREALKEEIKDLESKIKNNI